MSPLAIFKRVEAMQRLTDDAKQRCAKVLASGERIGDADNFFAPTTLIDMADDALASFEEPSGPITPTYRFKNSKRSCSAQMPCLSGFQPLSSHTRLRTRSTSRPNSRAE
ncbi:Glutarate-semialdehyde dehydrogenase DavD [compost metagenome]